MGCWLFESSTPDFHRCGQASLGCDRVFDTYCLLLKKNWVIACVAKTFLVGDRAFDYSSIVLLELYILPVQVYLPKWDAPEGI